MVLTGTEDKEELDLHFRIHNKNFSYLPMATVKELIKPLKFQSIKEYQDYVKENNLKEQGWPILPYYAYKREYKGMEDFLSLPPGTLDAVRIQNAWLGSQKASLLRAEKRKSIEVQIPKSIKKDELILSHSMNLKNICFYLIENDMISVVEQIINQKKMSMIEAVEVSRALLEYYDKKIKAVK